MFGLLKKIIFLFLFVSLFISINFCFSCWCLLWRWEL